MSRRNHRFIDSNHHNSPRPYNQFNPVVTLKAVTAGWDNFRLGEILAKELAQNVLYQTAWKKATEELERKKVISPILIKESSAEDFYKALIAFTLEKPPLYSDFNQKLPQVIDEASWNRFSYKSLYLLLMFSKSFIVIEEPKITQTLYRGISSHFQVEPKKGDRFYFDYMASFSSDLLTAEDFAGREGTIIILENGALAALGIRNYSIFPFENEVIVAVNNRFKVIKFDKTGPLHKLWLRFECVECGH